MYLDQTIGIHKSKFNCEGLLNTIQQLTIVLRASLAGAVRLYVHFWPVKSCSVLACIKL